MPLPFELLITFFSYRKNKHTTDNITKSTQSKNGENKTFEGSKKSNMDLNLCRVYAFNEIDGVL